MIKGSDFNYPIHSTSAYAGNIPDCDFHFCEFSPRRGKNDRKMIIEMVCPISIEIKECDGD